jgi:thiol peroxidase
MKERKGVVTFRGNPVTLIGPEIKVGQKAPDFRLLATDMKEVSLSQSKGKVRLLSVVTSLDTPVCDLQTQRFEEEAIKLGDVVIYTISMDLPFAQARYCSAHNIKSLQTLSDHRDASFGTAYGVLIKELRLLSRAIFIVDKRDTVRYVEYVKEITNHPDYDKALEALKLVVAEGQSSP